MILTEKNYKKNSIEEFDFVYTTNKSLIELKKLYFKVVLDQIDQRWAVVSFRKF